MPTLAQMKATAEGIIVSQADEYGSRLTAGYPQHERESWPVKIAEAQAILAGETDPRNVPVIATECLFTGLSWTDTALTIRTKAAPLAKASGAISGIRQGAVRRIRLAQDKAGIDEALAWAKASADAAFNSIMSGS